MWFRYCRNKIRTEALAQQMAAIINSKINPEDAQKTHEITKKINELAKRANAPATYEDLFELPKTIQIYQEQRIRLMTKLESQMQSSFPELDALMASSGFFKNPPHMATERSENSLGSYTQGENIIRLNAIVFTEENPDLDNLFAHELTHAKQAEHEDTLDSVRRNSEQANKAVNEAQDTNTLTNQRMYQIEDQYQRMYYNSAVERQAFLQTVIGELPDTAPTSYADFLKFLEQSDRWGALNHYLYPENKRSMIMSLYKHYQDLRPIPSVPDALKQESTPVSPMFAKPQIQPDLAVPVQ